MKLAAAPSQCSSLLRKNREPALCTPVGQDSFVKSTPFSVLHSVCVCVFMSVCACVHCIHVYVCVCLYVNVHGST